MAEIKNERFYSIDEVGRQPFDFQNFMNYELEHYFHCNKLKDLKENVRYTLLDEVEKVRWDKDKYYLCVKLCEHQTGKVILFDLAFLLKTILLVPQVDIFYERYYSNAFLNNSMRAKILRSKPYITKMEMIDYFKSLVKKQFIYFTFEKVKGIPYYCRDWSHSKALSQIEEHIIYNVHVATL